MNTTKLPPSFEGPACPMPLSHSDQIVLGHGSGGRLTQELIEKVFQSVFSNSFLQEGNDFARLPSDDGGGLAGSIAISTDSHIIFPLFFPGGDIGRLAVCGTVNDVSMSGAVPLYLTAGFILEEGLPVEILQRIVISMQAAAEEAGIRIVAGDTKVVERGKGDGLFINTTGIGWVPTKYKIGGQFARPGDIVIISGTLGDHGIAVLSARGELGLETKVESDTAPLNKLIQSILEVSPNIHVLRDPTRGGLATTLNEIAAQSNVSIWLDEVKIPVKPAVRAACEILGFDPLYIANEGKVIVILPPEDAQVVLSTMRNSAYGSKAEIIGEVKSASPRRVLLKSTIGGTRILDVLAGEMLPRIC